MATLSLSPEPDTDDKKKNAPSDNDSDDKKGKMKMSLPPMKTIPSADSVKEAGDMLSTIYKGKKGLDAKATPLNQRVTNLVSQHVVPTIVKNKEAADKYYNDQKAKNPDYPGASAKELDKVLGEGEGLKHIQAQKIFNQYHDTFSPKAASKLQSTPQGRAEHAPPSFGGSGKSTTEDLYIPDERLSQSNAMEKSKPLAMPKKSY